MPIHDMIDLLPGGGVTNGAEQQARSDAVVDDVARGPAGGGGLDDALHVRAGQVPLLRKAPALQQVSQCQSNRIFHHLS